MNAGLREWPAWARLSALRWTAPSLAAAAMVAVAAALGEPRLLFPEGLALVLGVWVLRRDEWTGSRWRIAVVPSVCALTGLLIGRAPGPRWVLAVLTLLAALLVMRLLGSSLAPAVSAAVLPVWFGIGEWSYLALVVGFCGLLALAAPIRKPPPAGTEAPPRPAPLTRGIAVRFALGAGAWLALVGPTGIPAAAAAPPLLVAYLEFLLVGAGPWRHAVARWALLSVTGFIAAAAATWIPWEWLAAVCGVTAATALTLLVGLPLGPALAIGLVPLVMGRPDPVVTGAAIAGGAAALHLVPLLLRAVVDRVHLMRRRRPPQGRFRGMIWGYLAPGEAARTQNFGALPGRTMGLALEHAPPGLCGKSHVDVECWSGWRRGVPL